MAALFIIFVIIAIYHFVVESIILPNSRLKLRYDLFELRDRLRVLKLKESNGINDELFSHLDKSICSTINNLSQYRISLLVRAQQRFDNDEKLRQKIEKTKKLFEQCEVEEISKIRKELLKLTIVATATNSMGWAYVVLPIILSLILKEKIKTISEGLFSISNNEFDKLSRESGVLT